VICWFTPESTRNSILHISHLVIKQWYTVWWWCTWCIILSVYHQRVHETHVMHLTTCITSSTTSHHHHVVHNITNIISCRVTVIYTCAQMMWCVAQMMWCMYVVMSCTTSHHVTTYTLDEVMYVLVRYMVYMIYKQWCGPLSTSSTYSV